MKTSETPYFDYIRQQVEKMMDDSALAQSRARTVENARKLQTGREFFLGPIHTYELVPLPQPLAREIEFFKRTKMLCGLIYLLPGLFSVVLACMDLHEDKTPTWRSVLWGLLAYASIHYLVRASSKNSGLFYPLGIWEQSLHGRKAEFERACRAVLDEMAFEMEGEKLQK